MGLFATLLFGVAKLSFAERLEGRQNHQVGVARLLIPLAKV